jgi:hypothetical protein
MPMNGEDVYFADMDAMTELGALPRKPVKAIPAVWANPTAH